MMLHLIRHGRTEANAQKRYCGSTDLPLSQGGEEELRSFAAQGSYPQADAFFTSGMLRARQTLSILYGDVAQTPIPDLSEFDFGEFEGRTYEQLRHDPAYIAWITDKSGEVACPGGESGNRFNARVLRALDALLVQLAASRAQSVVVVCHGGTIVRIMERLFPGQRDFYAWQPQPGLGYSLVYEKDELCRYQSIEGEVK